MISISCTPPRSADKGMLAAQELRGYYRLLRIWAVPLDRFVHDAGDVVHFRAHAEFRPGDDDGQTAVPDRERSRNTRKVAAEIGEALAVAAFDGLPKLGLHRVDGERGGWPVLLEFDLAVERVWLLRRILNQECPA